MRTIKITKKCWDLLLAYSLSEREILFLAAGKYNTISHIERVPNTSRGGRHQAIWSDSDYDFATKKIKAMNLKVICEGHSHPSKDALRHPSPIDVNEIPHGTIEVIVFPIEKEIRAWVIKKTLIQTLKNEVMIFVLE